MAPTHRFPPRMRSFTLRFSDLREVYSDVRCELWVYFDIFQKNDRQDSLMVFIKTTQQEAGDMAASKVLTAQAWGPELRCPRLTVKRWTVPVTPPCLGRAGGLRVGDGDEEVTGECIDSWCSPASQPGQTHQTDEFWHL